MAWACVVCGADLGWDRPSGVCSGACLRKGQGFPLVEEHAAALESAERVGRALDEQGKVVSRLGEAAAFPAGWDHL